MAKRGLRFLTPVLLAVAAGCTHQMTFTQAEVPTVPVAITPKGTFVISDVVDRRPADTHDFIIANGVHTWFYSSDTKAEKATRLLVAEALRQRGFVETENGTLRVDIEIRDFSGRSMQPTRAGFTLECRYAIRCMLTLRGTDGERNLTVLGVGKNNIARISEENMDLIVTRAYEDFLNNLKGALEEQGY